MGHRTQRSYTARARPNGDHHIALLHEYTPDILPVRPARRILCARPVSCILCERHIRHGTLGGVMALLVEHSPGTLCGALPTVHHCADTLDDVEVLPMVRCSARCWRCRRRAHCWKPLVVRRRSCGRCGCGRGCGRGHACCGSPLALTAEEKKSGMALVQLAGLVRTLRWLV